jgi:salicylate hydroxylase
MAKDAPSPMHRQHMVAVLERHLPVSCTVHPGKRLVNYIEPEQEDADSTSPIRLEFADGTTATTDVLIGADGIRSAVRKTMFEVASKDTSNDKTDLRQYIDATFTGMSVYRSLVSAEALKKENPENISLTEFTMVRIQLHGAYVHTLLCYAVHRKGQGRHVWFFP